MNRSILGLAIGVMLIAVGCSSAPQPAAPAPDVQAYAPDGDSTPPSPAANAGAAQEWDELLRRLQQQHQVAEQQKFSEADEHYRMADRWYQAGDFEKAELECQKALQLNPEHAPAHALYLDVQFMLNKGQATPASEEYQKIIQQAVVRHEQTLLEIDDKFSAGVRAYNAGSYEEAEQSFRVILEYAKWLPTGPALEIRRKQAMDMYEKTKIAKRQKEIDEQKVRRQMIDEERARDELRKKIEQKRELEMLFGQAQLYFEQENYTRCIEICERILYMNPNLHSVDEMRSVAQRLRHVKSERDNLKTYIEEWKRTFENVDLMGVVQAEELQFADREIWENLIAKRRPKGIQDFEREEMKPEDKEIIEKLKGIPITLEMQDAPLPSVIDYVRELTGLNFIIDASVETPDQKLVTIKVTEVPVADALRLILESVSADIVVEDGVVIITSKEALQKKVRLELYDVQDLTVGVQDFPGVDMSLSPDQMGASVMPEEGSKQVFSGEDLVDLIKKTIDKDHWEDEGKSIQHQNGLLIARNTIDMHKKLAKFLTELRASTGILVSVETRFLTVDDTFLQQVGMDFRDLDAFGAPVGLNLDDINPAFSMPPSSTFIDPDGPAGPLPVTSPGIAWQGGRNIQRNFAARVQNIMNNDFLVERFFSTVMYPIGGASLQYTLMDDVALEAIVRLVSRNSRSHVLTAPKMTLFNTQRGNIRISNQFAYIRDYDIQIATAAVAPDPVPDVVSDGITLDVRPIVSADRRFVTIELRPTIATLFPAPPDVFSILISLAVPGNPVTPVLPVEIETPILNISRMRTTVVIPDRGTLLIGGLTTYFEMDGESSIPVWRNIPILGNLGSNKYKGRQKKQLLVILRARIIIPDEEERRRFD
ncbi:MAG: tetratricopeptide repeat protein [Planctomycetes bacterium]|nr:tetratricopeptide repeat protein [Planctomycetota bacterium]